MTDIDTSTVESNKRYTHVCMYITSQLVKDKTAG